MKKTVKYLFLVFFLLTTYVMMGQNPSQYVVSTAQLHVRSAPNASSKILGKLLKGEEVTVYSIDKGWANIDFKGSKAYVSAKYIEEKQSTDVSTNKPVANTAENIKPNKTSKSKKSNTRTLNMEFTSTLSTGLSNFFSFDAYSRPRFGFGADAGVRLSPSFLPENMFSEASLGFMMLGNSNYSFPSIIINVLPVGYKFHLPFGRLNRYKTYAVGGLSMQLIGGNISFNRGGKNYFYNSVPTLNLYLKGGVELTDHWAVGAFYMHGLTNVCDNLPIGIKHSTFQVYGSYLFNLKEKKQ